MTFKEYYYSCCVVRCETQLIHQHEPGPLVPLLGELWLGDYLGHRLVPLSWGHLPEQLVGGRGAHQEEKDVICVLCGW